MELRSRRWDESSADRCLALKIHDPRAPLLETALRRLHDAALDKVIDQLPDHIAVCAKNRLLELGVAHELKRAGQTLAFRELGRLIELEPSSSRERFHGLDAPQVRAAQEVSDRKRPKDGDERLRLLEALLAEGTKPIILLRTSASSVSDMSLTSSPARR